MATSLRRSGSDMPSRRSMKFLKLSPRNRSHTTIDKNSLRVLVMGGKGVGKTSITRGFVKQRYAETYTSDNLAKSHCIVTDKVVTELVDTEEFLLPSMKKMAIRTSDAFVLVYAVDDKESFEEVVSLWEEIIEIMGSNAPIVIVGNKLDIQSRAVNPVLADCMITMDWECPYVETSAKYAVNLQVVFRALFKHPSLYLKVDMLLKHVTEERRKSMSCNKDIAEAVKANSPILPPKRKRTLSWQTIWKIFKR